MDTLLSDKAKGKRRALEHDNDAAASLPSNGSSSSPAPAVSRSFTIRFSEGVSDLNMTVGPQDTVREVQRRVRSNDDLHISSFNIS